jgi:hypothetical protein
MENSLVRTTLPAGTTVPIAWVAVGDPAQILPPGGSPPTSRLAQARGEPLACTIRHTDASIAGTRHQAPPLP